MQKEVSYVDNQIKLAEDFDQNISREFFLTLSYIIYYELMAKKCYSKKIAIFSWGFPSKIINRPIATFQWPDKLNLTFEYFLGPTLFPCSNFFDVLHKKITFIFRCVAFHSLRACPASLLNLLTIWENKGSFHVSSLEWFFFDGHVGGDKN